MNIRTSMRTWTGQPLRLAGLLAALLLAGCSSVGVNVQVPIGPFSVGVGVGTSGVSGNVGVSAGPVSAGVGVNANGQAGGTVGASGSVSVGSTRVGVSGSTSGPFSAPSGSAAKTPTQQSVERDAP